MSVFFHANFNLNRKFLSGVLSQLFDQPNKTDQEIAEVFGYNAPFTKRQKAWLRKCKLIEESQSLKLTDHGEVIFNQDSSLSARQTLEFIHHSLSLDIYNAEVWFHFNNDFLNGRSSFKKAELSLFLSTKLMPHDPKHFGEGAPMIKTITKVLLHCYTSNEALGDLKIIEPTNNNSYVINSFVPQFNWKTPKEFESIY